MPRLSFILPVYEPKLDVLEKCVKALRDQSFKDWEAIFVLDGDNEGAEKVIKAGMKGHKHFQLVRQEHAGAQRARNHGAKLASGEFWVFFDSDCVIEPETAHLWLKAFDKDKDVAFVYGDYKFLGEKGAINAELFDPWLLRVRNYISACFPLRREFYPGWNESLKSLQDWDFWLSVVEKGGKGRHLPGYHFSTAYPEGKSISATGCTNDVWLERVDAVKKLHGLPERDVCVSSLTKKYEGIWLAKLIDADYQDFPNFKPHRYKAVLQLGFSGLPNMFSAHKGIFDDANVKKFIYWTCDDIVELTTRLNWVAIKKLAAYANSVCNGQFVEDKKAQETMREIGFKVSVTPLPMKVGLMREMPEKPRFAVDIDPNYNAVFNTIQRSLPDVELVEMKGLHMLSDFTGLVHFHPDRSLSISMKRAALAGRHVISNVESPFMGYIDDSKRLDLFISNIVNRIREKALREPNSAARDFYTKICSPEALKNVLA